MMYEVSLANASEQWHRFAPLAQSQRDPSFSVAYFCGAFLGFDSPGDVGSRNG